MTSPVSTSTYTFNIKPTAVPSGCRYQIPPMDNDGVVRMFLKNGPTPKNGLYSHYVQAKNRKTTSFLAHRTDDCSSGSATLSAVAIPNYSTHVKKSRQSEAINALLATQRAYELYYAQNNTYIISPPALPSNTIYYTYSVDSAATAYTPNRNSPCCLSPVFWYTRIYRL